ncbi:MAG: O-antigen ligase family protein [Vogesella sp.]|nr:O-antigen ligase family protein [Vogesella sp.]
MLTNSLAVLVALFFATAMTVKGAANALVLLIGLASLPLLRRSDVVPTRVLLFWTLSSVAVLTIAQLMAGFSGVTVKGLDAPLRFVFAGLGLWGLSRLPSRYLMLALWGIPVGALGLGLWGWLSTHVQAFAWSDFSRGWNGFSNPIPFGVYSALFAFWAWILPSKQYGLTAKQLRLVHCLQVIAVLAAFSAAYYSGTRAAQLVCLPLLMLLLVYLYKGATRTMAWLVPALLLLSVVLLAASPDKFSVRFREGFSEIANYQTSHGTSMGLRLTMWQYGGQLVLEHPLTGVGKQGYYREVSKLQNDPAPLRFISGAPHPHNEILNLAVEFGVVGIAVGLALFLVPGMLFRRYLGHTDPVLAFAALAGILVVVCQFVAGLFDAYFWIVSQTSFYGMSVVIFASMIFSRKRELGLT